MNEEIVSLRERLPQEDKVIIERYIKTYAQPYDFYPHHNFAGVDRILEHWDYSKRYLYKIFGNQFIVKVPVSYEKDSSTTYREIDEMLRRGEGRTFYDSYYKWANDKCEEMVTWNREHLNSLSYIPTPYITFDIVMSLIYSDYLINNKYEGGKSICLITPKDKKIWIKPGCKVIRTLGKIAEAFDLQGFEEFRLAHSRILNQKSLKGDLHLSIHPLDFMTMSDNNCDWDSCMNWRDGGCYRRGTVEMMNSNCVVVAYLTSSEPFYPFYNDKEVSWTNKKWRSLIIINDDLIMSVKNYPYHNEHLTKTAIKILKKLMIENADKGKDYFVPEMFTFKESEEFEFNFEGLDHPHQVYFETDYMYNDFGTTDHYAVIRNAPSSFNSLPYTYINYSGVASCMWCGQTSCFDFDEDEACELVGTCCNEIIYCEQCGHRVSPDDVLYIDDMSYCSCCYNEYAVECAFSGEVLHLDNCMNIMLITGEEPEEGFTNEYMRDYFLFEREDSLIYVDSYYRYNNQAKFNEYFTAPLRTFDYHWRTIYAVHYKDCTPAGLKLFGYNDVSELTS
jgi:hypothetical protein